MLRPAILAAALLLPSGAAAAEPARKVPAAQAAQAPRPPAEGQRDEVLRLMDGVLADPADEAARTRLRLSAGKAAAAEKSAIDAERARLLAAARRDKAETDAMLAAKAARTASWKKDFSKACALAEKAETAREAVAAYERALETFPVYSDNKALLADSGRDIRAIFFKTIQKGYPYLAEGRTTADTKMLAALQFARASDQTGEYGGRPDQGAAEAALKKTEKFRRLEQALARQYESLEQGLVLYGRKHWAEALKRFNDVLAFDKANEEALYYRTLAKARAAAAREKR